MSGYTGPGEHKSGIMQAGILIDTTDQTFDPSATLAGFPVALTRLEDFVHSRAEHPAPHVLLDRAGVWRFSFDLSVLCPAQPRYDGVCRGWR